MSFCRELLRCLPASSTAFTLPSWRWVGVPVTANRQACLITRQLQAPYPTLTPPYLSVDEVSAPRMNRRLTNRGRPTSMCLRIITTLASWRLRTETMPSPPRCSLSCVIPLRSRLTTGGCCPDRRRISNPACVRQARDPVRAAADGQVAPPAERHVLCCEPHAGEDDQGLQGLGKGIRGPGVEGRAEDCADQEVDVHSRKLTQLAV